MILKDAGASKSASKKENYFGDVTKRAFFLPRIFCVTLVNMDDFDLPTRKKIEHVIDVFKNFSFEKDDYNWKVLKIDGKCLGTPEIKYYVLPLKGGFHVQVDSCNFGVMFFKETDDLSEEYTIRPYYIH